VPILYNLSSKLPIEKVKLDPPRAYFYLWDVRVGMTSSVVVNADIDNMLIYAVSWYDFRDCPLKVKWCPRDPARQVNRDINEAAGLHRKLDLKSWQS
jgi:hypothetical protein